MHQLFRRFEPQKFSLPALGWPCVFSLSSVVGWSYSRTPQVDLAAALTPFFPAVASGRPATEVCRAAVMKFIEMTGKSLKAIVKDDELHVKDLPAAGVQDDTVVRVNQHGDIEVRLAPRLGCDWWIARQFRRTDSQRNGHGLGLAPPQRSVWSLRPRQLSVDFVGASFPHCDAVA